MAEAFVFHAKQYYDFEKELMDEHFQYDDDNDNDSYFENSPVINNPLKLRRSTSVNENIHFHIDDSINVISNKVNSMTIKSDNEKTLLSKDNLVKKGRSISGKRSSSLSRDHLNRLAQPKSIKKSYVSLAEAVLKFETSTPVRFRSNSYNNKNDPFIKKNILTFKFNNVQHNNNNNNTNNEEKFKIKSKSNKTILQGPLKTLNNSRKNVMTLTLNNNTTKPTNNKSNKSITSSKKEKLDECTKIEPFSFDKRDFGKKKEDYIKKVIEEEKKARIFHAQPIPKGILSPPQPLKLKHMFTDVTDFYLNTELRALEREKFDEKLKLKEESINRQKEIEKQEQLKCENEFINKIRKETLFKANPIRKYKHLKIEASNKLTEPVTPLVLKHKKNKENHI